MALATGGCGWILGLDEFTDMPAATPDAGSSQGGGGSEPGSGGASSGGGGTAGGDAIWSHIYGDANAQAPNAVAVDGSGSVYVIGSFTGAMKLGDKTLISAGADDIFLAKLDAAGNPLWSKQFGDAAAGQTASGIAIDKGGNVTIGGSFHGSIKLGATTFQSDGANDVFVTKFDPQGDNLWSQHFGGQGNQTLYGLAVDPVTSDIGIIGAFSDDMDFVSSSLSTTSSSDEDIFIAKLAPESRGVMWVHDYGDASDQFGRTISIDPAGNILVAGAFKGALTFGSTTLTLDSYGAFVAKLDTAGNSSWAKQYGGMNMPILMELQADDSGNILLAGHANGTADLGCGPLTSAGDSDVLLAKLDTVGNCLWNKLLGGTSDDYADGVTVDANADVVVTGSFSETLHCDGDVLASMGSTDIFVAKFRGSGERIWCERFGGASAEEPASVAISPGLNEVLLAGWTDGSLDFGTGPLTSAGNSDAVIAKLAP